jgi:hypothetical protein
MKLLINGEIYFTGTESECLKQARLLAESRRKSEIGKQLAKVHTYGSYSWSNNEIVWRKSKREIIKSTDLVKKANWQPIKIEFAS